MNNHIIKILFIVASNRLNKKGKAAIKCRVTFQKQRKEFTTGLFIAPKHWKRKQQTVMPTEPDAEIKNTQLSLIRTKLNQAFLFLQVKGSDFTVNAIYRQYLGETPKKEFGVMEVYSLYSDRISKLVGIEIKQVTYAKYLESGRHLKDFIRFRFISKDIKLIKLKASFLDHYEYYLKTEKKMQQSTLNKAIQRFRRVIRYAISEDYLDKDPFILYKAKRVKKDIKFLSVDQLKKLENNDFEIQRIQQIKEMFVFCCYTGLGFKEMTNLKKSDIKTEFDGELWVTVNRVKTSRSYKVPLLPQAKLIMEKYEGSDGVYVLPRISNPKFNAYLKEIADVVGIDFNLTHHIARKTFASTVLLYNDIPMEIVSRLLGHSNMKITQDSYGQIAERKISIEIKRIKGK